VSVSQVASRRRTADAAPDIAARVARRSGKSKARSLARPFVFYAGLTVAAAIFLLPLIWVVLSAFKPTDQIISSVPLSLPTQFSFQNFTGLFKAAPVGLWFRNSLIYSAGSTIGALFSASLVGYGFARGRGRSATWLFMVAISVLMVPFVVTIFPQYAFYLKIGWINTFYPLIVPAFLGVGGTTLFIFLMRQFFISLPPQLEEAAALDGASAFRTFWMIMLPLARPALTTVAIFQFVFSWNDFFGPLVYFSNSNLYTLPLGIATFSSAYGTDVGPLVSLTLLSILPIIIVFVAFQRYFIRSVATAGLK
jgi:multiple sugar transport system permease protein